MLRFKPLQLARSQSYRFFLGSSVGSNVLILKLSTDHPLLCLWAVGNWIVSNPALIYRFGSELIACIGRQPQAIRMVSMLACMVYMLKISKSPS